MGEIRTFHLVPWLIMKLLTQLVDFYLVSHSSIQGVSRPTKYHLLWNDDDVTENKIEKITYYLCHMLSRCTHSVSYPAPT
jgi:eukaryotic translation initiation factor 2C